MISLFRNAGAFPDFGQICHDALRGERGFLLLLGSGGKLGRGGLGEDLRDAAGNVIKIYLFVTDAPGK